MKNIEDFKEDDYKKDVDLHIHSCFSDGLMNPDQITKNIEKYNLKKISICDHNTVEIYQNENINNNNKIIKGVEFDCWHKGVLIHILGYDIDVNNEDLVSICAKTKLGKTLDIVRLYEAIKRTPKKAIEAIHKAKGKAVLAHSACYWTFNLDLFVKSLIDLGLDGLEVFYPYRRHRAIIKFHKADTVKKIAEKYSLLMTGGTDTHDNMENYKLFNKF